MELEILLAWETGSIKFSLVSMATPTMSTGYTG